MRRRWGVARRSGCFWYTEEAEPAKYIHHFKVLKRKQESKATRAPSVRMEKNPDMCSEGEMVDVIRGGGEVKLWQSRGGDIWKEVGEDQVAEYDEQNIDNEAFDQVEEILTEFYGN